MKVEVEMKVSMSGNDNCRIVKAPHCGEFYAAVRSGIGIVKFGKSLLMAGAIEVAHPDRDHPTLLLPQLA